MIEENPTGTTCRRKNQLKIQVFGDYVGRLGLLALGQLTPYHPFLALTVGPLSTFFLLIGR